MITKRFEKIICETIGLNLIESDTFLLEENVIVEYKNNYAQKFGIITEWIFRLITGLEKTPIRDFEIAEIKTALAKINNGKIIYDINGRYMFMKIDKDSGYVNIKPTGDISIMPITKSLTWKKFLYKVSDIYIPFYCKQYLDADKDKKEKDKRVVSANIINILKLKTFKTFKNLKQEFEFIQKTIDNFDINDEISYKKCQTLIRDTNELVIVKRHENSEKGNNSKKSYEWRIYFISTIAIKYGEYLYDNSEMKDLESLNKSENILKKIKEKSKNYLETHDFPPKLSQSERSKKTILNIFDRDNLLDDDFEEISLKFEFYKKLREERKITLQ